MLFLIPQGEKIEDVPFQTCFKKLAYFLTSFPPVPYKFFSLIYDWYLLERMNSFSSFVWLRHYNPEFMKQVFPRFYRPVKPFLEFNYDFSIFSSIS